MRLITDGVTPVPRLVLVDTFETDGGHFCELADPLFLMAGDLILFDGGNLSVTRADGTTFTPAGAWGVRCIPLRTTHPIEPAESAQATA
ncbi:hypothetical protein [Streptomyces sp. HUAS TT20]|uniref:hypothetical protein n=1 Tax=Streptomyces sp. HUAS TT20 TaxID=3447509 RepID=UPI0021D87D75|nr:hypothetical protein [Streptomyces sp. HUAS 15-9]UXY25587.1 hypothetical protein N8I87_02750 [Streptomyces sp. HUAS 15-9]